MFTMIKYRSVDPHTPEAGILGNRREQVHCHRGVEHSDGIHGIQPDTRLQRDLEAEPQGDDRTARQE
jgi:hypothetical protein